MEELKAYRTVLKSLPGGIESAEVEAEKHDIRQIAIINDNIGGMKASSKTSLFVRVAGEKSGMTYTQDLGADPGEVLKQALENGCFMPGGKTVLPVMSAGTAGSCRPGEGNTYQHSDFSVLKQKLQSWNSALRKLEDQEAGTVFSHLSVKLSENIRTMGLCSSTGLELSDSRRIIEVEVELTAEGTAHKSTLIQRAYSDPEKSICQLFHR